jgi:hypothetical protein
MALIDNRPPAVANSSSLCTALPYIMQTCAAGISWWVVSNLRGTNNEVITVLKTRNILTS